MNCEDVHENWNSQQVQRTLNHTVYEYSRTSLQLKCNIKFATCVVNKSCVIQCYEVVRDGLSKYRTVYLKRNVVGDNIAISGEYRFLLWKTRSFIASENFSWLPDIWGWRYPRTIYYLLYSVKGSIVFHYRDTNYSISLRWTSQRMWQLYWNIVQSLKFSLQ